VTDLCAAAMLATITPLRIAAKKHQVDTIAFCLRT
jgi:ABC-type lipoprotein release transport system permease subunit